MTQPHVFKKRLLKLADLLYKLPPKRFYYGSWVGEHWLGKPDLSCGTSACALGWATTVPSFRKLGLQLKARKHEKTLVTLKGFTGRWWNGPRYASEKVFGLNENEMEYLFVPESGIALPEIGLMEEGLGFHASAKEVAKHIRQFVKAKYNRAKAR